MYPLTKQYNKFAKLNKSIIQKALTTATGIGEAHIPQNLEKLYTDTVIRLSPELALITPKKIAGKVHEFNKITARPTRGGAAGESSTIAASNSKTSRESVTMKIVKRKGQVSYFLADTSEEFTDVSAFEMEQHLQAHVLDLIYYCLYGNADAPYYLAGTWTTPASQKGLEFDGIDKLIATNRHNESIGGTAIPDLTVLDTMIDQSNRKGGARHVRAFGMSPEMLSAVSHKLTNVRLNQDYGSGLTQVDIVGGWRMNAYRNIPIIETTSTRPIEKMSPTITISSGGTTTGGLSDGTYYFRIAPVTYEGEQEASDEQSVTLSGGGSTQWISIAFDAPHTNAASEYNALSYKIYAGTSSGSLTLKKIVSAFTYAADYSANDPSVAANNAGVGSYPIKFTSMTCGNDVPTGMQSDKPFVKSGSYIPEMIYLWDVDPIQGLGKLPYANTAGDQFNGLVTTKRLAEIEDYLWFLIKSYCALCPSYEATSVIWRGLRTA